jgi:5-formyltetrahydrofolate cyclo-ligase
MKQRRAALSSAQVAQYSNAALDLLMQSREFRTSRRIGIYFPIRNELSPLNLTTAMACRGKKIYLPVIMPMRFQPLLFAPFASNMVVNRYGIPEPMVAANARISVKALDLLLVPLLAYDNHGARVGFGAGYYDRTLAFLKYRRHWCKPRLIGLAYSFQHCAVLPKDSWDVRLPKIITEKKVIVTKVKSA